MRPLEANRLTAARQGGWGLTETLLTLGAMSVMSVAIYAVLKPTDASAQVKIEQDNLRTLSQGIDRSMGLLGSFQGLNAADVITDELAPRRMRSGGGLRTAWGAPVAVASHQVNAPNDSFVVSYPNTPTDVCASLASAMSRDTHDIRVGGGSVFSGGNLDPGLAAQRCSAGNVTMDFIFHSGLVSGQAVAAAPVVLPPPPPTVTPPPGSPPIITIPGTPEVNPVTPGTPAVPPPASPPPVLPPPVTPPATPPPVVAPPPTFNPPPPPVTPPGVVCSPPASWVDYDNRTPNCAVNQYGVRTQQRTQNVSYTCPEAWGNPVEARTAWSSWADTTNTCATCPTLSPEPQSQWLTSTGSCPAGYAGTVSHQYEQVRTRARSYNCPAGTTSLPPISYGTWSGWSNTGATRNPVNSCLPTCAIPNEYYYHYSPDVRAAGVDAFTHWNTYGYAEGRPSCWAPPALCVVPNPATQTNTETRTGTQTLGCPAGHTGSITQSRPEQRTQTRTASCPTPTGSVAWTPWSSWSAWTGTGGWTTTSNTCVPEPPACEDPSLSSTDYTWCSWDGSGWTCQLRGGGSVEVPCNLLPPPPPVMLNCECTGSMYVGGGFVSSFGTFPTQAACEAALGGTPGRVCVSEITRFPKPPNASCFHMLRTNWQTAPKTMFCEAQ